MAFGRPTRYLQLDPEKIPIAGNKREIWDRAVKEASDEYKMRMVNITFFLNFFIFNIKSYLFIKNLNFFWIFY